MKRIFDLYIRTSLHVSLAVASFTALTFIHFELPGIKSVVLYSFFATVAGYNFIKYAHLIQYRDRRLSLGKSAALLVTVISVVGLGILSFQLKTQSLILISLLGGLVILYPNPFLNSDKNLRKITGLKIFIIAVVWAGITVLFPAIESDYPINSTLWSEFAQRLLFVILLTLPFDLRDLRSDIGQIKTIPVLIGIRKTKILAFILAVSIITLELVIPVKSTVYFTVQLLFIVIVLGLIFRIPLFQSRYFASFWVEGIPIAWFALSWWFVTT